MGQKSVVDESSFDTLSIDSAYWLGFLITDGCVSDTQKTLRLRLCIHKQDIEHLNKFKTFLQCNKNLYFYKNKVDLTINSNKLCKAVMFYGITPRKTYTAKAADILQNNIHFWRGCIDGDGCLFINKKYKTISLSLVGSELLLNQFLTFCKQFIQTEATVRKIKNKNAFSIHIIGHNAKIIMDILYKNDNIVLDRKQNIYNTICKLYENKEILLKSPTGERNTSTKLSKEMVLNIRQQHKKGTPVSYLSSTYNVCTKTIYNVLQYKNFKYIE